MVEFSGSDLTFHGPSDSLCADLWAIVDTFRHPAASSRQFA